MEGTITSYCECYKRSPCDSRLFFSSRRRHTRYIGDWSRRVLFRSKAPAMQQFDLGKFQDQTMAYPPSVVVKDYSSGATEGYLQVDGTRQRRFKTVIQIVPMPGR